MNPFLRLRAPGALPPSALALALLFACGDDEARPLPTDDAGPPRGVHPRFDPAPDPMPFGSVPWPDDLYLGPDGRIRVGELPGEEGATDRAYFDSLRVTLADLDGFGAVSPVMFTFDGAIDPSTLPASPAASTRDDASVFLLDVDPGSPEAFSRVPVRVNWEPESPGGAPVRRLAVRPDDGHSLVPGRRYAAVVTRRVRADDGTPLVPDPDFAAVRDATTRPTEPLGAEAHDRYGPVLDGLASRGVARADVVALAVFRVQTVTGELTEARARVWEVPAPVVVVDAVVPGTALGTVLGAPVAHIPGLDVEGGVAHDSIGFMIHGRFQSPWLLSDAEHVHGRFARETGGRLHVGRFGAVPFTLLVPRAADVASLRVVLFQHGLGGDRSDVMAFADALAGAGYAVLAIDAPFHGMRSARATPDVQNRFTGEEAPDGFGDALGSEVVTEFAGVTDTRGELVPFHPVYFRDALRQGVVDLLSAVRLIREAAAWDAARAADPALASLGFAGGGLAFVGDSLGGVIGAMLTAVEPEVTASVLAVTGGHLLRVLADSPPFNDGYLPLLFPLVGLDAEVVDYDAYHPVYMPELAILQTLLDRGDPINYARALRGRSVDLMMFMARHDETLSNVATESLARAAGLPMVGAEPAYTDIETAATPLRDNATIEGDMLTRALYVHEPATHRMLLERTGESRYAHPVEPPFEPAPPRDVRNPIDGAVGQMLHFFESWRSGAAEIAAPAPM